MIAKHSSTPTSHPKSKIQNPKPLSLLWIKSGAGLLHPLDTGGKKRTHAMLREISRHHRVDYLALRRPDENPSREELDDPYAASKEWIAWTETDRGTLPFYAELLWNRLLSTKPYSLTKYVHRPMQRRIRELVHTRSYDLVICDYLYPVLNVLGQTGNVPTILFQHNTEAQIWERLASTQTNALSRWYFRGQHRRMAQWERRLCGRFDGVITVSPDDSKIAQERYGLSNVLGDVPGGVDFDFFSPGPAEERDPNRIAFLGSMDWIPNVEGVHWFHREVLPLLRRDRPDLKLVVIGRKPAESLRRLAAEDPAVELTGTVDDVRDWVQRCSVLVVPLLSGSGTRIKILEAMAMGIPIVSTTVGAEGLGLASGTHLLLADDPESFARATAQLLDAASLRHQLAATARAHVVEHNGWDRAAQIFIDLCQSAPPPRFVTPSKIQNPKSKIQNPKSRSSPCSGTSTQSSPVPQNDFVATLLGWRSGASI